LEQEILDSNLKEYFRLPGFVLNAQRYFDVFDIFVLPSVREGFPLVLLEAGAAGVPTVAFDVGGNSEIIRDGYTGFIVPEGNLELLVDRIWRLYSDVVERRNIGRNAKKYVRRKFSSIRRARALLDYYEGRWSGNS
jgi:glycosyltransferase involved in cell wall biosynthesis